MRTTIAGCVCLLLCGLAAVGCHDGRSRPRPAPVIAAPPQPAPAEQVEAVKQDAVEKALAQPKPDKGQPAKGKKDAKKPAAAPQVAWSAEVKGWGVNVEAAEKHALEKAELLVRGFLRGQEPPFTWQPPADYVRKHLLTTPPKRCSEEDQVEVAGKLLECWCWTVAVSPGHLTALRLEETRERARAAVLARSTIAEARMLELSKLLGWVVLALTGLFAYIRLDDWTRGESRRWLRVALGSVLVSGAVGWWLLS